MAGDYSRARFKPLNDFSSVLNQQGKVQLDADWNELNAILDRRWRAESVDIAGRCWVPNDESFKIQLSGANFTIAPGRIYVDGLLAENHGWMPSPNVVLTNYLEFDAVLVEQTGTLAIPYDRQPYLPVAPQLSLVGSYLIYIDVWQREVTYLERPDLVEQAVAFDTTTRKQTVWQVRALNAPLGATCSSDFPAWNQLTAPSAGQLTTGTVAVPAQQDPCIIPPTGGYRGLENHLYRIEIHDPGPLGTATFKMSRDNASMATNVTAIPAQDTLTVVRVGRDSIMRFNPGDWIEIKDDWLELNPPAASTPPPQPGIIRQIKDATDATSTITLDQPLPPNVFQTVDAQGNLDPSRHTRIIRWDQQGKVLDSNANLIVDLDAAGSMGVIPVPSNPSTSIVLENGIQVTFTTDSTMPIQEFHTGDYWTFAARTADASIEIVQNAPPREIHHHFCRLALLVPPRFNPLTNGVSAAAATTVPADPNLYRAVLTDCRCVFSPISPTILDFVSPGECQYIPGSVPPVGKNNEYGWTDVLDPASHIPKKQINIAPPGQQYFSGATVVIPINPILRRKRDKLGQLLDGATIFYELSGSAAGGITLQLYRATLPLIPIPNQTPVALATSVSVGLPQPSSLVPGSHTISASMGAGLSIANTESAHMELTCAGSQGGSTTLRFLGALLEYAVPGCQLQSSSQSNLADKSAT
jgi:hypothetical protein